MLFDLSDQERVDFQRHAGFDWAGAQRLVVVGGSQAHGTTLEDVGDRSSDLDLHGVVFVPIERELSWGPRWERWKVTGERDIELISSRLFVQLLMQSAPNVTEWLWTPPELVQAQGSVWDELWELRKTTVTRKLAERYVSMGNSQLSKMKESLAPTRKLGAKRKAMKELFGYDPKNGSHMIRAFRMARDIAALGEVNVRRVDAEELRRIKQGMLSFDEVVALGERDLKIAQDAINESRLPTVVSEEAWSQWYNQSIRREIERVGQRDRAQRL